MGKKNQAAKKNRTKITVEQLINLTNELVILITKDGTVLEINKLGAKRLEKTIDEVVGRRLYDFFRPEAAEYRKKLVDEAISSKTPVHYLDNLGVFDLETSLFPVFDDQGEVYAVVIRSRDITRWIQTERDLDQSERNLRALLDATDDLVALVDIGGNVLDFNRAMVERLGIPKRKVIGKNIFEIFPPDVAKYRKEKVGEAIRTKNIGKFLDDLRDDLFETTIAPIRGTDGEVNSVAIFAHDVTHLHSVEQELRKSLEKAQEADLTKSRLMATLSHELRTPLVTIVGLSDLLLTVPDIKPDKAASYHGLIKQRGEGLLSLIDSILDISKIEAGAVEPMKSAFNIHKLINKICADHVMSAEAKGLSLNWSVGDKLPKQLIGDASFTKRVIDSLLENALKFTSEGTINVNVSKISRSNSFVDVLFEISDTGCGIPHEDLDKIFEPFYQVDGSAAREKGGAGLGLAIAKELVETMGGRIWAQNNTDFGCSILFQLTLEAASNDDDE